MWMLSGIAREKYTQILKFQMVVPKRRYPFSKKFVRIRNSLLEQNIDILNLSSNLSTNDLESSHFKWLFNYFLSFSKDLTTSSIFCLLQSMGHARSWHRGFADSALQMAALKWRAPPLRRKEMKVPT